MARGPSGHVVPPVALVVTGFSRGACAAGAFARLLDARVFTVHAEAAAEPETVAVAAMLLRDPMFTGIVLRLCCVKVPRGNLQSNHQCAMPFVRGLAISG